ncbi:MAG: HD-GYP domain-containing protein [Firmicutes bacterium]|nr:HD-GYP domain-containing protein [Bacillota bacterium]
MIMAMTKMLEIHDTYTNNHSKSVAEIATKIAEHMDISKEKTKEIYWAGIVHDIGKTIIPSEIINKKGKLTDEEFEIIKKHPIWGYEALKNSEELKDIANYVRYHHERWDGNGYPDGLEGEDIPLIAQILTVADTWNAMTSDRSYRKALPKEVAKEEILKNKGSQFSPNVVDAFIDLLENVKLEYNLGRSNA